MKRRVWLCQVNNLYGASGGRGQAFLPYSVGLLQAYAQADSVIREHYDFAGFIFLREDIQSAVARMGDVNVFAASCYIWDAQYTHALAKAVKAANPNCLVVLGGPHVPNLPSGYAAAHPYVDLLIHYEGEHTFKDLLLERLKDGACDYQAVPGLTLCVGGKEIRNKPRDRIKDLDALPSPYLTGVFDDLMNLPFDFHPTSEVDRGCVFSCTFCIAKGTMIQTKEGAKPIEDILPGDLVLGWDEGAGSTLWNKVEDCVHRGRRPVWSVNAGRSHVKATEDHLIYTNRGWQEVRNIHLGDKVFSHKLGEVCWAKVDSMVFAREEEVYDIINATPSHNYFTPVLVENCDWGSSVFQKVRRFGDDRLFAELDWFAHHQIGLLYNASANFAMTDKDVVYTERMVQLKRDTGYPKKFRAAYAKNSNDRVFAVAKMLNDAGMSKGVTLSFQSMDENTLTIIKRKNIGTENYSLLARRYRQAGIPTYSELIIGLPGESYHSFAEGISKLLNNGAHDSLQVYTCLGEGTLIQTPLGNFPVEEITENQLVYGWDERADSIILNKVQEVICHGIRDVWSVQHETGEIETTANHRIYTDSGWKAVEEIKEGDKILSNLQQYCEKPTCQALLSRMLAEIRRGERGREETECYTEETQKRTHGEEGRIEKGEELLDLWGIPTRQSLWDTVLLSEMCEPVRGPSNGIGETQQEGRGCYGRKDLSHLWQDNKDARVMEKTVLFFRLLVQLQGDQWGASQRADKWRVGRDVQGTTEEDFGICQEEEVSKLRGNYSSNKTQSSSHQYQTDEVLFKFVLGSVREAFRIGESCSRKGPLRRVLCEVCPMGKFRQELDEEQDSRTRSPTTGEVYRVDEEVQLRSRMADLEDVEGWHRWAKQVRAEGHRLYEGTRSSFQIHRGFYVLGETEGCESQQESRFHPHDCQNEESSVGPWDILASGSRKSKRRVGFLQEGLLGGVSNLGERTFGQRNGKESQGVRWSTVRSVAYTGRKRVYDLINLKPFPNFFANDVLVHNCECLPNSEMSESAYRERHKIKSVDSPVPFFHGTPSEDKHPEIFEIVTSTATLDEEGWLNCQLLAWVVQAFHCLYPLQPLAVYLKHKCNISYRTFYEKLLTFAQENPNTLVGEQYTIAKDFFQQVRQGTIPILRDAKFSDVCWPPEEWAVLQVVANAERFFLEVTFWLYSLCSQERTEEGWLKEKALEERSGVLDHLALAWHTLTAPLDGGGVVGFTTGRVPEDLEAHCSGTEPEKLLEVEKHYLYTVTPKKVYGSLQEYAQQVVWYGRKGGGPRSEVKWERKKS